MSKASRWKTPTEAAVYVGCDPNRVYEAAKSGALAAYVKPWSIGSSRKYLIIHEDDIDAWVRTWPSAHRDKDEEGTA